MYVAILTGWREHRPRRGVVRQLRAELVAVAGRDCEESDDFIALNDAVGAELRRLPRWQRLAVFTEPAPRRS